MQISISTSENIHIFGNDWGLYVDLDIENPQINHKSPDKINERLILKHPLPHKVYLLDKCYFQNVEEYNDCSFLNGVYKTLTIIMFIYLLKIFISSFAEYGIQYV
jgi:hypothetical protein